MSSFWDKKFEDETYRYGTEPNVFVKEQLGEPEDGKNKALFPFEGEGRNAVFAATLGWNVLAFDSSSRGREKALALADEKKVTIRYDISDVAKYKLKDNGFDVIVLCYAHMPPHMRTQVHRSLGRALKPGGKLILEAFSKDQLAYSSGGPQDLDKLFSIEELKNDFEDFIMIEMLRETKTQLSEGEGHNGKASVIRLVCSKPVTN